MPVKPASPIAAIKSLAAVGIRSGFACSTAKFLRLRLAILAGSTATLKLQKNKNFYRISDC